MDAMLRYKLTYQGVLVLTWTCLGWLRLTISVSTPDLREYIGVDYEQVTRILFSESAGFFAGSLLGGMLFKRYIVYTELIMAAGISCGALGMFLVPFQHSLPTLAVCLFMFGISMGVMNIGGNTKVLHLWGDNAGSPMHSLHCAYGIGSILAPQFVKQFLSKTTHAPSPTNPANTIESIEPSNLTPPFCGAAIAYFQIALLLSYLYLKGPPQGFHKQSKTPTLSGAPNEATNMRRTLHILLFLFYFHVIGSENGFDRFILPFIIESPALGMSMDDATFLMSVYWIFFTAGRGAAVLVVRWLTPHQMIIFQIVGVYFSACLLAAVGSTNTGTLWFATCLFGLLNAPMFAGGLAWANLVLQMNSVSVMICLLGGSSGSMFYVYTAGYLFQYAGTISIMYMQVFILTILAGVFACMEYTRRRYVKCNSLNT